MGEVTISVAGRAYQVVCEDGEEDRLSAIAARVDHEAKAFGDATPSLSESRLLLMCSLLLADKLDEVEKSAPVSAPGGAAEIDTSAIEDAATRIEALTNGEAPASEALSEELEIDEPAPEADSEDEAKAEADEEITAEPVEANRTERRSKSSAAMAAEKDLLSWLDRPEPKADEPEPEEAAPLDPSHAEEPDETVEPEPAVAADPAPEPEPEESEEELAARDRADRRARRRERLARLANQDDDS